MAEEDVVCGGLDTRRVLDGYEGDVVNEGPHHTESQLCRH